MALGISEGLTMRPIMTWAGTSQTALKTPSKSARNQYEREGQGTKLGDQSGSLGHCHEPGQLAKDQAGFAPHRSVTSAYRQHQEKRGNNQRGEDKPHGGCRAGTVSAIQ